MPEVNSLLHNEQTPLGVYVHWPYCLRICPYCDFNVYKNREIDVPRWLDAVRKDLRWWADNLPGRPLRSLYFGGGTPSLAPLPIIETVIETCDQLWGFEQDAEISLETNPHENDAQKFIDLQGLGINRLSLGVQSLRDDALKFLGRDHSAAIARTTIEAAAKTFSSYSFDLIYARPNQSLKDWRLELAEALALSPPHLSLYQLTIEPGTAFANAVRRGAWMPTEGDLCADFYETTQEMTSQAGLHAYEISNHAKPGHQSQHNLIYWHQHDYIGIGPSAHGRARMNNTRIATETPLKPDAYLATVETNGTSATKTELSLDDQVTEHLSMGLRLTDGCIFDAPVIAALGPRMDKINLLVDDGFLYRKNDLLAATPTGRRVLNAVLAEIFT